MLSPAGDPVILGLTNLYGITVVPRAGKPRRDSRMPTANGVSEPWCGRTALEAAGLETVQTGQGHASEAARSRKPGKWLPDVTPDTIAAPAPDLHPDLAGARRWADQVRHVALGHGEAPVR